MNICRGRTNGKRAPTFNEKISAIFNPRVERIDYHLVAKDDHQEDWEDQYEYV